MPPPAPAPLCRTFGCVPYLESEAAMRRFTEERTIATPDEIWLCEHPSVYTQGVAGRDEHVLDAQGIAVVRTNRGGQITYHGPGQVLAYPLIDLRRLSIYVREFVFRIETAVLKVLESYDITGHRVAGAPGIYVRLDDPRAHAAWTGPADKSDPFRGLGKVAALGIKVSRHCSYHGVALNVAMDLRPFDGINPCGYPGLQTVDLARLGVSTTWHEAAARLAQRLASQLSA